MRTNISVILLLLTWVGCKQNETIAPPQEPSQLNFTYSHEDSVEGAEFALWFQGKLLATDSTERKVMYSLKYLRYKYSDSLNIHPSIAKAIGMRFFPPWAIGQLSVKFDSIYGQQVRAGVYAGWDSLSPALRPDTILQPIDKLNWMLLGFSERYNPLSLAEYYRTLPGVLFANENGIGWVSEKTFPVFPGPKDGELSYVFIENGNTFNPYFYFRYIHGEPVFIGVSGAYVDPKPAWWEEAGANIANFSQWQGF